MAISIKAARVNAGMRQTDVALALHKSRSTIQGYENYTRKVDIVTAQAMAALYGVSVDDIIWTQD